MGVLPKAGRIPLVAKRGRVHVDLERVRLWPSLRGGKRGSKGELHQSCGDFTLCYQPMLPQANRLWTTYIIDI